MLVPFVMMCKQPAGPDEPETPDNPDTPVVDPQENPDDAVPQEVKNGQRILVTNAVIEKFITTIHYNERDYTSSAMQRGNEADFLKQDYIDEDTGEQKTRLLISPGKEDLSVSYSIRWPKDTKSEEYTAKLSEGNWSASYTLEPDPDPDVSFGYWIINNLRPNAKYHYEVKNGSSVVASGEFETYGSLHHLTFKPGSAVGVRNVRDLGGWKTKDGKTVKYRMVYRGGRPEKINKKGVEEAKNEGIRAELDLRGTSDHLSSSPFADADFLSPVIEEGYDQMLRDDKEKTRQCMQFIFDCVDANKPVYFHCSLGRDRTGTVAMLTLGILGVPEGDISQEYEITQFAPHGYATSEGEKVKMLRTVDYKGAANVIWGYASGGSFQDGVNAYLLEIGISQEDINKFKQNMLQ